MWETWLDSRCCEQYKCFCKLQMSQGHNKPTNNSGVILDYSLSETVSPDSKMSLSNGSLYVIDWSSCIRFHFRFACSNVIDSLEASRWVNGQYGQMAYTDDSCCWSHLRAGLWFSTGQGKDCISKSCFCWMEQFTSIFQKGARGQSR